MDDPTKATPWGHEELRVPEGRGEVRGLLDLGHGAELPPDLRGHRSLTKKN